MIKKSWESRCDGMPSYQFASDLNYDFSFRPETYWPDLPGEKSFLSQIKGTQRRDIARRALAGEELERLGDDSLYREAMEFVLQDQLSDKERQRWGAIHPTMLGGEFLPESPPREVEIARLETSSVTGDVYEIRARLGEDGRIFYRAVDEYWDEGSRLAVTPEATDEPLTLGQLIELIDTARQVDEKHIHPDESYNVGLFDKDWNFLYYEGGGDPESLVGYIVVRSPFYPTLEGYYRERDELRLEEFCEGQLEELCEGQLEEFSVEERLEALEERLESLTDVVTSRSLLKPGESPGDMRALAEESLVFNRLDLAESICANLGHSADDLRPMIAFRRGDFAEAARLAQEIYSMY